MKLSQVRELAEETMKQHGLNDWSFEFDRAVRRFGCTHFNTKTITMSQVLCEKNDLAHVKDTILHEIAHALVGKGHGHNRVWKYKAVEVGCNPSPYYSNEVVKVERRWIGTCPNNHKTKSHKRMKVSCSKCDRKFNADYMFVWKEA